MMTTTTQHCRIDDLNDNLLESIFTRLIPSKHLAIARCVSKRWNSIITDPDFFGCLTDEHSLFSFFLKIHLKFPDHDQQCLVTEHPFFQRHSISLDFLPKRYYHSHLAAYHKDLLLSIAFDHEGIAHCFANPLTKQFVEVSTSKTCTEVYHALSGYSMVGFAGVVNGVTTHGLTNSYDNSLGYRIVHIHEYPESGGTIYSSETRQWKFHPIDSINRDIDEHNILTAVTLNDKLHWVGALRILVIDPFDDDNLAPRFLNLPEDFKETIKESVLGVCRNRLQIAHFEGNLKTPEDPRIKVWEFTNYDDDLTTSKSNKIAELSLVTDFTLEQTLIDNVFCSFARICPINNLHKGGGQIVCCHPNDPDIVYFMYRYTLLRCDVIRRKLKVMVPFEPGRRYMNWPILLLHPFIS